MESTTERLALTRELEIDASPETVWELLVDPVKMTRWMGMSATLEAWPGGVYRCHVVPGHTSVGEVIEVDPPRRLVHTWGWEEGGSVAPGSTTVEYELVPSGSGTLLRFTHRDLPGAESVESHGQGWDHYFERLAVVAAGGEAGVDPWITERSN